jgi:glutamate N-acetyltransferase/amino-acid N-acetyltransferase
MTDLPAGFSVYVANMGVKDESDDVMILVAPETATVAGVFTKSRFSGPSVVLSRENVADGRAEAVVIVSKNANVATGPEGESNAREVVDLVAAGVGCRPGDVLIASTCVIGVQYPMDRVRDHLGTVRAPFASNSADAAATAIMTTDTHAKVASAVVGAGSVVGFAKGVGMIEPDMATMLAVITTDAEIAPTDLDAMFRRVVARTFNALSVDTDTSTSDSAIMFASGSAGPVDLSVLEAAVYDVALDLTRQLAFDGEGAETLIVVNVEGARDDAQAKRVAKAIVNSPLVKTAVHGADPNWGRVAMAIGKCSDETDIEQEQVVIRFGDAEVYPAQVGTAELVALEQYLDGDEVHIGVDLAIANGSFSVYGCDLTDGYVRINADYTT